MDPMDIRKERLERLLIEKEETIEKLEKCKDHRLRVQLEVQLDLLVEKLKEYGK
jgi:hypothetical protein